MIAKWKNPVLGFDHHTGSWEVSGLSPTETDRRRDEAGKKNQQLKN